VREDMGSIPTQSVWNKKMAYRKVRAGLSGSMHSQGLDKEEIQTASLELEWDMEKELEEPCADGFQLEPAENRIAGGSPGVAIPELDHIEPSVSPHGRFERLEEDPDYVTHFTRPISKGQRNSVCPVVRYLLVGTALFVLGLIVGRFTRSTPGSVSAPPADTDFYQRVLSDITAEKIRAHVRALNSLSTEDGELSRALYLLRQWTELGLTDVHLVNYSVLLSLPSSSPNTITVKTSGQCFYPNRQPCHTGSPQPTSNNQLFSFAAYSASGTLEGEMFDVQYGNIQDLSKANASTNGTNKIALLKLGQAPLLYKLSLLVEAGFAGVLTYVDPCDLPRQEDLQSKAFSITLNPGGDPSTPMYPSIAGSYRELRADLTSLLVQPISASLARELLSLPEFLKKGHCIPLAAPTIVLTIGTKTSYKTIHNVIGYLKGATNPDRYVLVGGRHGSWLGDAMNEWSGGAAVMTQIITSLTIQARKGWQPDRTTVFCSWGGSEFGNIGSFEWGENQVVLQSNAVAYISLHHPVSGKGPLHSVASPSLLQLVSDIHKKLLNCTRRGNCTGPNVNSVQTSGDVNFFANHLAIPTAEFAFQETSKTSFLSEAFFPDNSSVLETLDPSFSLHETVAKVTGAAILRVVSDPVLPFYPLDIALEIQNKLKGGELSSEELLQKAASLRESTAFFQSEMMRPANDPKERDPSHVRMLNDVLRDLERSFTVPQPPPGLYRNILYNLNVHATEFSILKDAQDMQRQDKMNQSLSQVLNAINSAERLIRSGLELFENDPTQTN
uniref:N-acetylated alpha-linked acidic dipeptidase like 2 n=1 Tax=Scleropages formosus TaxID=113540 RepID=A0A8C9WN93_SCLFO